MRFISFLMTHHSGEEVGGSRWEVAGGRVARWESGDAHNNELLR